jgi:hypothetical protein
MLPGRRLPHVLIAMGCSLFVIVLWLSAYWEANIRWLHFLQAWMYVACVWLSLAGNRWGYFVGISAAAFWNYTTLFVNTFFLSGLTWLFAWIRSGELKRADQIVAAPAWLGNLLVIAGCIWAYTRLPDKRRSDLGRLAVAFVLTTGFFAAAIAVCQPRYLPLFQRALHPRWPW